MIVSQTWNVQSVSGIVRDNSGHVVNDAIIRIKTTEITTRSDEDGHFLLAGFVPSNRIPVTAWKDGYYVAGKNVRPWDTSIELVLTSYTTHDNQHYTWIPPTVETRSALNEFLTQTGLSLAAFVSFKRLFLPIAHRLALGCRDCHGHTVFDQWAASAHASGAKNVRFLTMYNGTDVVGNQSPPTRYGYNRDYGSFPLRPDPNQPYYGPGYRLDFPETFGNCATCHLPSSAIDEPYAIDPNQVIGVDAQGTHCDFCHKIAATTLDRDTGQPHKNMPGILSLELARPRPESQLFFGPYDDVDVGPDTYLPLMRQSEICAPCHNFSFWGVPIYQSFAEWQASPYPAEGKTCQSCHMKPDGVASNFAPSRGGLERAPKTIPTHHFPGAADTTLLQNAVTMDVSSTREAEQVTVKVTIVNDKTGHHVPTDSPLRHLILLVRATDAAGNSLTQLSGPTLPDWCGVGDHDAGYYAGLPGRAYAKILEESWTGISPTAAYWNMTRIVSDNRIAAFAANTSIFTFDVADHGEVAVNVKLLFRRAFVSLINQKGWEAPDIVMAQQSSIVRGPHGVHVSEGAALR
jgi:hypothetical protein